jgi:hypothetical protein
MILYRIIEKSGNTYFVSSTGSMAIVLGKFYKDGKKAPEGLYTINIDDGSQVLITVGVDGQVIDKQVVTSV